MNKFVGILAIHEALVEHCNSDQHTQSIVCSR